MEIAGEHLVPAPQQRVWSALNDPQVLRASIVGCQSLEKVSETEFSAIVMTKVGPVTATFRGSVKLSDIDAPHGYTLTGQGQGGAAGFAKMSAKVALEPREEETLLRYTAHAEIGGKLANVGSRLVQAIARKNAEEFFSAFTRQLGGEAPAAGPQPQAPAEGAPVAHVQEPRSARGTTSGPGALVPAWLVVFSSALAMALGYCLALLAR